MIKREIAFIHIFIHKLKLFWSENTEILMDIEYGSTLKY